MERIPVTPAWACARLVRRAPDSHKGTYGKVLAVCGCERYRGAAALAVLGALRAGAGLVTLAAPECVAAAVAPRALEATFLPLPEWDAVLEQAAAEATACVLGCGRAADGPTRTLMQRVLSAAVGTVVLDAGGLCAFAGDLAQLAALAARCRLVVTPHPGEAARLLGCTAAEVEADREAAALRLARSLGAVTVLKGHRTLTACPNGKVYENATGNAGLARGGSGDLLAGIIAGLAAQGTPAAEAAAAGVCLHGLAADRCAQRRSMQGMLPEDILEDLGAIFLENERRMC